MKKRKTASGLMLTGSFRQSGVTIYQRNGKLVTRTATSDEKRSNTLGHCYSLLVVPAVHHRGGAARGGQELWRTDTETVPLTRIDGEVPEAT